MLGEKNEHMPWWGGQRETCKNHLSPSTIMGPGDQSQDVRVGIKHLYPFTVPLNHLAGPQVCIVFRQSEITDGHICDCGVHILHIFCCLIRVK